MSSCNNKNNLHRKWPREIFAFHFMQNMSKWRFFFLLFVCQFQMNIYLQLLWFPRWQFLFECIAFDSLIKASKRYFVSCVHLSVCDFTVYPIKNNVMSSFQLAKSKNTISFFVFFFSFHSKGIPSLQLFILTFWSGLVKYYYYSLLSFVSISSVSIRLCLFLSCLNKVRKLSIYWSNNVCRTSNNRIDCATFGFSKHIRVICDNHKP